MKKIVTIIIILVSLYLGVLIVEGLKEVTNQCWIYNQAEEEANQALLEEVGRCLESKIQCSKDFNKSAENFNELFLELEQCYEN